MLDNGLDWESSIDRGSPALAADIGVSNRARAEWDFDTVGCRPAIPVVAGRYRLPKSVLLHGFGSVASPVSADGFCPGRPPDHLITRPLRPSVR